MLCWKTFDNLLAVGMFKPVHPSVHPSIPIYLNEGRLHMYNYIYIYILYAHTHLSTCSTLHSYRYTYIHILRFALLSAHIGICIYIYIHVLFHLVFDFFTSQLFYHLYHTPSLSPSVGSLNVYSIAIAGEIILNHIASCSWQAQIQLYPHLKPPCQNCL